MAHEFTFKIDGELVTFTEWEDIPENFDNVIKFDKAKGFSGIL